MTIIEIICSEVRRNDRLVIERFDKIEIYPVDEDTIAVRIYYDIRNNRDIRIEADKVVIRDPYFHCSDKYEVEEVEETEEIVEDEEYESTE